MTNESLAGQPVDIIERFGPESFSGAEIATTSDFQEISALAEQIALKYPDPTPVHGLRSSGWVRPAGTIEDTPRMRVVMSPGNVAETYRMPGTSNVRYEFERGRKGGDVPISKQSEGESISLEFILRSSGKVTAIVYGSRGREMVANSSAVGSDVSKDLVHEIRDFVGNPDDLVPAPTAKERRQNRITNMLLGRRLFTQ
jgi:hypothetical protein